MLRTVSISFALLLLATPPARGQAPASTTQGEGRGRISSAGGRGSYPQRPPAEPAVVERGGALYTANCAFCHGQDTRGGNGGPSLLRSPLVLADQNGERIGPVVRAGRVDPPMPKFNLTDGQIADLAAFMHSFSVAGYDTSRERPVTILVGNASAGAAFFAAKCATCHSTTGDLQGLATRIPDERVLQQSWLMPGTMAGRGAPVPARARPPTVTVTLPNGEKVTGVVGRVDDFVVSLTTEDGTYRTFQRTDGRATVVIQDPLQPHKALLATYTDADIHNVTAFLATLR